MSLADLFGGEPDDTPPAVSADEFFEACRNERRRLILKILANVDGWIDLHDLARTLGSIIEEAPESDITGSAHKKFYVSVYQTHVPALEDQGFVATNDRDTTVSITPAGRHALDVLVDTESRLEGSA